MVRKLNTGDLIKCAGLIGKIGKQMEIPEGATNTQLGLIMFSTAMSYAETDFTAILANVAEMTVEEFRAQDFDYPLQLVEEIAERQDLTSFLQRVKALNKKISKKQ